MKDKNKTYTAADFARYHNGTMPANEMHALEKAALENPFLEDALEGYANTTSFESDIRALNEQLAVKRKKKKTFVFSTLAENKWWRIAALLIIIAGAGYFFYQTNNSTNTRKELAKNVTNLSPEMQDSIATHKPGNAVASNDSIYENQLVTTSGAKKKNILSPQAPSAKREYPNAEVEENTPPVASQNRSITNPEADSSFATALKSEDDKRSSNQYVLKGRVTDDEGIPVPFASVKQKNSKQETVTDTAGNFSLLSQDSSTTALASASRFKTKSFSLDKDLHPTVSLNKTNESLAEVVVSGYGTRRKKSVSLSKVLNGKADGVKVIAAQPQPYGGQEEFDQYIQDNKAPVYGEKGESLTGEIMLSFTINKKGKPEEIKVIKSSCSPCEKEAIRLLENGPVWTGKKGEPGQVIIKF